MKIWIVEDKLPGGKSAMLAFSSYEQAGAQVAYFQGHDDMNGRRWEVEERDDGEYVEWRRLEEFPFVRGGWGDHIITMRGMDVYDEWQMA